ncbi:hypothetical protein SEA_BAJUNIPER_40 [Microbacterium phage BAjuniper]|nr:hypothetical protein SEA_BAJUNIPER_40 [Microbacterium phage BAjuniper]
MSLARRVVTGKVRASRRGFRQGAHQYMLFRGAAAATWLRAVAKRDA